MAFQEVGYWKAADDANNDRPNALDLVDEEWVRSHERIQSVLIAYLHEGHVESYEMGYSYCRFPSCAWHSSKKHSGKTRHKGMGACNLTDGIYVWPEGLTHYLASHSLRLPNEDLIARALLREEMSENTKHRHKDCCFFRCAKLTNSAERKMWDHELGEAVPLSSTMKSLLQSNTTLFNKPPSLQLKTG
jgi:hypothetical protein